MIYFESVVTVLLKEDVVSDRVQEFIGKFLNQTMLLDSELKSLHKKNGLKGYVYDSLSPIEFKTKIYKTANIYVFRIRSLSKSFLKQLERCMKMNHSNQMDVIAVEHRTYKDKQIDSLYTVTPVIVTVNNQPWMQEDDVDLFIRRLEDNAEKKLKALLNEEVDHCRFIEGIEFTNRKPVPVAYKGITLLGHKIRVKIKTDTDSQKLAHVVLGSGISEKNAIGNGFCLAHFI
ncbi:CRISPR-associated endoribonuclease Cas6 [Lederbergia sp. NSJ-179]|uniref:CRISPR-associated endoribonuclease Cas6 n=1 Tax=Lederbergia sp. NSJ-179 TaxID=2931402 RepID=UPI001FD1BE87|nr:CRISPR-associated endoribonuclease Cas6 [Lederbergia sp. NSJ-179]MCJ7840942.1 CRISPR-associated endoribonuclease Cas6 [Lederbergia sp. NSJ-179]